MEEVTDVQYAGLFDGNDEEEYCTDTIGDDGCAVDTNEDGVIDDLDLTCEPMLAWLENKQPWYDQPVATTDPDPNLI